MCSSAHPLKKRSLLPDIHIPMSPYLNKAVTIFFKKYTTELKPVLQTPVLPCN